jgi:hypothetical protein
MQVAGTPVGVEAQGKTETLDGSEDTEDAGREVVNWARLGPIATSCARWLVHCWLEKKQEDVMRDRCTKKMQLRVGVGVEFEVFCNWSFEE